MAGDKFKPITSNPKPWKVNKRDVWHSVVADNGKTVCNCRNILDAEEIVKNCNIPYVSGSFSLDFIKWYSGMEEQKILNAYERYKRESGNDR